MFWISAYFLDDWHCWLDRFSLQSGREQGQLKCAIHDARRWTTIWTSVTHFGNAALLLPSALVIMLWLLVARRGELAVAWASCFGGAVLLVFASKVAFLGWGMGIRIFDFTGISGHSTLSTAVFPMLGYLMVHNHGPQCRRSAIAVGLLAGIAVSVSRLMLNTHSISEVVGGFALGAMAALLPIRLAASSSAPLAHRWVAIALVAFIAFASQLVLV